MTVGIEQTEKRLFGDPKVTRASANPGQVIEFELPLETEFYTLQTIQGYLVVDENTVRVTRQVNPDDREMAEADLNEMGLSLVNASVFLGPSEGEIILKREEINAANLQIPQKKWFRSRRLVWWENE